MPKTDNWSTAEATVIMITVYNYMSLLIDTDGELLLEEDLTKKFSFVVQVLHLPVVISALLCPGITVFLESRDVSFSRYNFFSVKV